LVRCKVFKLSLALVKLPELLLCPGANEQLLLVKVVLLDFVFFVVQGFNTAEAWKLARLVQLSIGVLAI
jgi:hypothetical protein